MDKSSLTFTTSGWSTAQTVTVSAGQDADAVGDSATLTHVAAGGDYGSVSKDLAVAVTDDDTAALALSAATLAVTEGGSNSYTVALATQPSGDVTVTIGGTSGTDLGVDKSSLTFTTSGWSTAQTVTVSAGQDADAVGDSATLTHVAAGGDYGSVSRDLAVTVTDDDTAALALSAATLAVTEGGSNSYTVALATQPSGDVTVTIGGTSGTDSGRGQEQSDVHDKRLEHSADGDGERGPGRRRGGRQRDADARGGWRGLRVGEQGPGGDGDRRRHGGAGAERRDAGGDRRRQQQLHGGACHAAERMT